MPGTILENLSGKKLLILVTGLSVFLIACFLVGGFLAPPPSGHQSILATKCFDKQANVNGSKWFYTRGVGACNRVPYSAHDDKHLINNVVYAFQMPQPRTKMELDYSRWHQNLVSVLSVDIPFESGQTLDETFELTLYVKLAYRNKGDADDAWVEYASSVETRTIECSSELKIDGYNYNCSLMPLFELGSVYHDYYLLNVRLPVDSPTKINMNAIYVTDLHLTVINQNGGFTMVWLAMKLVFFPFILAILVWFRRRVNLQERAPVLLENMLFYLGVSLMILDAPVELLTLVWDLPFMLLLNDVRQGVFYSMLLSFWLVFAGEHMLVQGNAQDTTKKYWPQLSAVALACVSLFMFDLCERGAQLFNPFYSTWVSPLGAHLALSLIIVAALSASAYFVFLCYLIWRVFNNISVKRSSLPHMSKARRIHYEGIMYRFRFLMLSTLICAAFTIIAFIVGQVAEDDWKWDEHGIEYSSAFFTGVFGMWNVYIFALIVLYSPSHKHWPSDTQCETDGEQVEFSRLPRDRSPSEITTLTSFIQKATVD